MAADTPHNPRVSPGAEALEALARQPDGESVVILNVLRYASGREDEYEQYSSVAIGRMLKHGGRVLYSAGTHPAARGSADWDRVLIVEFPSRAAYLTLQRDAEFRSVIPHRDAGLEERLLYALRPQETLVGGIPRVPVEPVSLSGGDEIFVLNLLRFEPDGGLDSYLEYAEVVAPMIQELGGFFALTLAGELPLVSEETWDEFVLVRYPSLESLQTMVASAAWQKANKARERGLANTIVFPTRP